MSDFFKITARKKEGRRLTIYVETTHPDVAWIAIKKNVALQMIWDALDTSEINDEPLGEALTSTDMGDVYYLTAQEDHFISAVKALEANQHPAKADLDYIDVDPETGALPQALLEIQVTDARWIAHITAGQTWTSAAFDMESEM